MNSFACRNSKSVKAETTKCPTLKDVSLDKFQLILLEAICTVFDLKTIYPNRE
jgi:hypothetical protein